MWEWTVDREVKLVAEVLILVCVEVSVGVSSTQSLIIDKDVLILVCVEVSVGVITK